MHSVSTKSTKTNHLYKKLFWVSKSAVYNQERFQVKSGLYRRVYSISSLRSHQTSLSTDSELLLYSKALRYMVFDSRKKIVQIKNHI